MTLSIVILQGIQLEREEQGVEGLRGELLLRAAQRRHLLQRAGDARAAVEAAAQGRPAAIQLQARRQAQAALQARAQDAAIQVGRHAAFGIGALGALIKYPIEFDPEIWFALWLIFGEPSRITYSYKL